jgi:hypothetical protein
MTADAQEALAFLTCSRDRRACYVERRLLAKFRHFGRMGDGYLRAPMLKGFSVIGEMTVHSGPAPLREFVGEWPIRRRFTVRNIPDTLSEEGF